MEKNDWSTPSPYEPYSTEMEEERNFPEITQAPPLARGRAYAEMEQERMRPEIPVSPFAERRRRDKTRFALTWLGIPLLIALLVAGGLYGITTHQSPSTLAIPTSPALAATSTPTAEPSPVPTSTPTPTPSMQSTPSPSPSVEPTARVGTVLCQYNATTGWNGWVAGKDWQAQNHVLSNTGAQSIESVIYSPCSFGDTDHYAMEVTMQVTQQLPGNPCFHIDMRGAPVTINDLPGWMGHQAAITCGSPYTAQITWSQGDLFPQLDPRADYSLIHAPFNPGTSYHTYRIEVQGSGHNTITWFIDGKRVLSTTDGNTALSGQVALGCYHMQVNISSIRVIQS